MFDESRIQYTKYGYNYVEITPSECFAWGGMCICNFCNKYDPVGPLYLIWALGDVYCKECFDEWKEREITYSKEELNQDLLKQKEESLDFYKYHLDRGI